VGHAPFLLSQNIRRNQPGQRAVGTESRQRTCHMQRQENAVPAFQSLRVRVAPPEQVSWQLKALSRDMKARGPENKVVERTGGQIPNLGDSRHLSEQSRASCPDCYCNQGNKS
jgi:hypothetical protein